MFRSLALAGLLIMPLPAAAQDMPLVDHVANALLGLQAGYQVSMGDVAVPIKQLAPGVFEASAEGQRTVTTSITELEPCVFNYEARVGTRAPQSFQFDFKSLDSIAYRQRKIEENGLTLILLDVEAKADFAMRNGKPVDIRLLLNNVTTDIPLASLEGSVAALKTACPTGDPAEGMELTDHLVSVMLGLHHGYEVPVANSAVQVLRTGPGVFEIHESSIKVDYKVSVREIGACLFELEVVSGILAAPKARVDATKLTSVAYEPTTTDALGMTTYIRSYSLEPGFKTLINADGTTKADDDLPGTARTDAPLELLEGSAAALLAACP